tara:strand:+ start:4652 stop:9070 length:4419 start_codon:yes stop_codon:yes gene_type:complete
MSINAQPFSPTFKLVGNLSDSQILVYDASENAFVNATNTGAGGSTGLTSVLNTGTGEGIGQATGSALELKSLVAGTNLTITDNGSALVIDASVPSTSFSGTNLGTGTGIYKQNNASNELEFKSISVGAGLTLTEANDTLNIECTISTTGFLQATNNLSDIGNVVDARTNLDVYSKAESDAKYLRIDASTAPTVDNQFDLGSSTNRFNDIYAETFQGTALLADNLTVQGSSSGDVLTWNGSTWVASAPAGGGGGGGGGVAQTLSYSNNTLSISGGNSVTITPYVDLDPYVRLDQSSIPTLDNQFDIGSPTKRYQDVYAESFQGTAVLADNLTISGTAGQILTYNGSTWVAADNAGAGGGGGGGGTPQTLTLTGSQIAISGGNNIDIGPLVNGDYNNLANKPTIPADVSDLTDTTNLLSDSQSLSLSGTNISISGGNSVDLAGLFTNTDNQTLSWNSANNYLTISNGNYVDLSALAGGGGASNITDLGDVDTSSAGHTPTNGQALVWSQAMGHWMPGDVFDGDYNSLSNQPTIPANQTLLLSGTDLSISGGNSVSLAGISGTSAWSGITGTPTTIAGYGITDAFDGDYNNLTNKPTLFSGAYADLTGKPTIPADVSDLTDTTSLLGGGSQSLSLSGTQLSISGGNTVDFAGMFTDTDNQTLSFNTGTNILTIANGNTVDLSTLAGGSTVSTIDDLSDVAITGTSNGQFLVYNNTSGEWENQTVNIFDGDYTNLTNKPTLFSGSYTDLTNKPTIPANLGDLANVSSSAPSTGHVLKWSGSEWAPAADSTATGGSGISLTDLSSGVGLSYNNVTGQFALNASIGDLLDVNTSGIASGQILKWNGSAFVAGDDNVLQDTDSLPEGSANLYYTDARFDARFNGKTTDNLVEGTTNKYYSDAQVDARLQTQLQAGTGINITVGAGGVLTIDSTGAATSYTDADARSAISLSTGPASGNGSLSYNSTSGAFTFAPADLSNYSTFDGDYNSLTNRPSIVTLGNLSATNAAASGGGALTYDSGTGTFTFTPPDLSNYSTFDGNYNNLTNKPTSDDIAEGSTNLYYTDARADTRATLRIGAANLSALNDVNNATPTDGQVLTWDNAGSYWKPATVSGGGGGSYGDSDVESYMGQFDFHILPDTTETYDIGSASKKIRHLFLSDNSLYIGSNQLTTSGTALMFNSADVQDWSNIKNKPTIPADIDDLTDNSNLLGGTTYSAGTGLQLNTNTFSLNANLSDLQNVSSTAPSPNEVLKWNGSEWAPATDGGTANLSSNSIGELNDVNISGIASGNFLSWDGTKFVATAPSAADLTNESITELQDVSTDTPNNGDVLTWDSSTSAYKPSAPASGGGGGSGGTATERFKLNYSTAGQLSSISNTSSGVSATILSATGGDVEITFSGHSYPPAGILIYGYVRTTNEYAIMPLNKDIGTRKVAAGGSPGSPTAFGSLGSSTLTLTLREADTGASRSFGTDTHAWVVFTMI